MVLLDVSHVLVLLVCAVTVVRGTIPHVVRTGSRFKLEEISDSNIRQTLDSIGPLSAIVQELDFSGNTLTRIRAEDLQAFENLQTLDLSTNTIQGAVDLSALPTLRSIDISNNFVTELLVGPSTERLVAPNNEIVNVTCIGGAPEKLILANNRIKALTDLGPSCRSRLVQLDLSLNAIAVVDFSELLESRETLRSLSLAYNAMVNVRNSGCVLFSKLAHLDVSSNRLAYMGEAFQAVANVGTLDASHNKLVLISHELVFQRGISSFDLRGNGLSCGALQKFFRKNEFLAQICTYTLQRATGADREDCAAPLEHVGPYCCEQLAIPVVDRLVRAKRGELRTVSSIKRPEQTDCEKESLARRAKVKASLDQYRSNTDGARGRAREQVLLMRERIDHEQILKKKQAVNDELETLLKDTAADLGVSLTTTDSLQILKDVLQEFEETYEAQEKLLHESPHDLEKLERYIKQLTQEQIRLQQQIADLSARHGIWSRR